MFTVDRNKNLQFLFLYDLRFIVQVLKCLNFVWLIVVKLSLSNTLSVTAMILCTRLTFLIGIYANSWRLNWLK